MGKPPLLLLFPLLLLLTSPTARAIPLEALDTSREWLVKDLTLKGNKHFFASELEEILSTKTRPWYAPWRERPRFDPEVFASDLQRIERFYQARGFYEAKVAHDLATDDDRNLVSATILINENPPVLVGRIAIDIDDHPELRAALDRERAKFPLKEGKVFAEDAYQQTAAAIKEFFYDQGRARVEVGRRAEVLPDERRADVFYSVHAGPETFFGPTKIEGLKDVTPDVVERELAYKPGDRFSGKALRDTRRNLLQLDLFGEIDIEPQLAAGETNVVPVAARLREKPPHEIKIGVGYGTEDKLRGQARWRDNNFLGGARQLEVGLKVSFIARELDARFVQPHFLGQNNRFTALLGPRQFDEPGYKLNLTRFQPRFERKFSDRLSAFVGYRVEYDQLSHLSKSTFDVLKPFDRKGWLSAVSLGSVWNTTDDRANPTTGALYSLLVEEAGTVWGGSYDFVKLLGESRWYYPLAEKTVLASRLKLGFADTLDGSREVPIFERFFAGGADSVRGYERRGLGPMSPAHKPVGGRSLFEGSVELRQQQLWKQLGGVLFLDFGQVSLRSFDPPVRDLKFAAGFGFRYGTPIGPLRLDFGFPFQRGRRDRPWQIFFDIGQTF
ncbi:MAG TPA: outer membrane protein assembly factor BamA [Candidatus Binatia bacterium]